MAVIRKLTQIGNSKGIILPQTILEMLEWDPEGEVELKIEGKKLVVTPYKRRSATAEPRTSRCSPVRSERGDYVHSTSADAHQCVAPLVGDRAPRGTAAPGPCYACAPLRPPQRSRNFPLLTEGRLP